MHFSRACVITHPIKVPPLTTRSFHSRRVHFRLAPVKRHTVNGGAWGTTSKKGRASPGGGRRWARRARPMRSQRTRSGELGLPPGLEAHHVVPGHVAPSGGGHCSRAARRSSAHAHVVSSRTPFWICLQVSLREGTDRARYPPAFIFPILYFYIMMATERLRGPSACAHLRATV